MSLRPKPSDDGPVKVHLMDGNVLRYDRLFHEQSGMVTLFDVEREERENAGDTVRKGDRARTVPVRRIDHIEWPEF
jgi:hypothetical protein